jgi:hypothetical protein
LHSKNENLREYSKIINYLAQSAELDPELDISIDAFLGDPPHHGKAEQCVGLYNQARNAVPLL